MSTENSMRMERIHRLLKELEYEVQRGIVENEIGESLRFEFIIPISHQIENGLVIGEFETRPVRRDSMFAVNFDQEPRFKLVPSDNPS